MKRVLIVSPHFPPINAPDMQRVRMSLPYYRAQGWEPVVLTVDDRRQEGAREPELLATLPPDVRVVRVGAIPARWTRRIGISILGLRAWPFLFWRGARLLRREKFDLVFFSTTQFLSYPLGPLWKLCFGVPYVIDVQDPWRNDVYERPGAPPPPGGWKYQAARLQAWLLERWCFTGSAAVMSVSAGLLAELADRYPEVGRRPTAVIGFGASPADMAAAAAAPSSNPGPARTDGRRHVISTGAAGSIMERALVVLFSALQSYRKKAPGRAARLRFEFIGTSYAPAGTGEATVLPLARRWGVEDLVGESPGRVGFLEALRRQREADALLLLGSDDAAYSPSKIYYYYLTGRPVLALALRGGVMQQLLSELGCASTATFPDSPDAGGAEEIVHRFLDGILDGVSQNGPPGRNDRYFRDNYQVDALTARQCALFEAAIAGEGRKKR